MNAKEFYDATYGHQGLAAQRRYPNEELCRFMGRNFFGIPHMNRSEVRILEVGCGSGANLWMIAREGFNAYGIDFSPEAIRLCAEMLNKYGTTAQLSVGDMTKIPFPNGYFDAIVDVFSSYCLDNEGHGQFLDEVRRLLKPGGLFFSFTPSKGSDAFTNHAPARMVDASTLSEILRPSSPYFGNNYLFRFTTIEEFTVDLRSRGMVATTSETLGRTYRNGDEYFEFVVMEGRVL